MHAGFIIKNTWFLYQILHIFSAQYRPKPFISGAIKNIVKKALQIVRVVLTNARTNHVFAQSFSPRYCHVAWYVKYCN